MQDYILQGAADIVNVAHNNRATHIGENAVKRKARADAKWPAKRELREAKRNKWAEWADYRLFARHEAREGRYVLPARLVMSKTKVCVACSEHQYATAFTHDPHVCDTCIPQVDATRVRLAAFHASLARKMLVRETRKPSKPRKPGKKLTN